MPIKIDSELWNSSNREQSTRQAILEFLRSNPNTAYNQWELSDEIIGTRWEERDEREREIQRVGENEYYERNPDEGPDLASTLVETSHTEFVKSHLSALVYEGSLNVRRIPNEKTDIPEDEGDTAYYAYAGA